MNQNIYGNLFWQRSKGNVKVECFSPLELEQVNIHMRKFDIDT